MNSIFKNKLINGDSLKELKKIPDETFDLIFADPPYNLQLKKKPSMILIDGNKLPKIENYKLKSVIKGDQKIPSISAASIIAKVARDNFISKLGIKYKSYSWGENYGYGTKKHLRAIKKFGATVHHRKTFSPLNKLNTSK